MEGDGGTGPFIDGVDVASGPDEMAYTLIDKAGKVIAVFKSPAEVDKWLRDQGQTAQWN